MTSPATTTPGGDTPRPLPPPGDPDAYLWPGPEDFPNIEELVIEDGAPVDGIFSEKQMRLLAESLHASWRGVPPGEPFVVMANVGVFHTGGEPPVVPDVLLATGIRQGDVSRKENLAYFVWLRGKPPDVVIEVVSNREGGEDGRKLEIYARIGVSYYVIFDPEDQLRGGILRVFQRQGGRYRPLARPFFFAEIGLGVDLWQGRFEDTEATWLRWRNADGSLLATGAERAEQAEQRATQAEEQTDAARRETEAVRRELEELKQGRRG